MVSARRLGLALRLGLLVVRLRLRLVSRLGQMGLPAAGAGMVGRGERTAGSRRGCAKFQLGPTARIAVEIDTALAKIIHPDQDHQYEITAEVIDASRRTVVGSGRVLVARKPFQAFVWVDRGYYHVDDVIKPIASRNRSMASRFAATAS